MAWSRCGVHGCPDVGVLSAYQHGGGALLLDRHGDPLARPTPLDRRTVPLEAPSAYLSEAFLAVEDKSFREHGGIDWLRVPGALLANLRSNEVEQDFSTITMQLARNVFPERISASQWRRELWRQPPRTEAAREEVFLASRLPPEGCPARAGGASDPRFWRGGRRGGAAIHEPRPGGYC